MLFQMILGALAVRHARTRDFASRCRPKVSRLNRGTFRQKPNRPRRRSKPAIGKTTLEGVQQCFSKGCRPGLRCITPGPESWLLVAAQKYIVQSEVFFGNIQTNNAAIANQQSARPSKGALVCSSKGS